MSQTGPPRAGPPLLGGDNIDVFYGLWEDDASDNSSNWKEFYNQVMKVE
jgi:hypothetical protein